MAKTRGGKGISGTGGGGKGAGASHTPASKLDSTYWAPSEGKCGKGFRLGRLLGGSRSLAR